MTEASKIEPGENACRNPTRAVFGFRVVPLTRGESLLEKPERRVTRLDFAVPVLGLHARLRREVVLDEGVEDLVLLVAVDPEPVGLEPGCNRR